MANSRSSYADGVWMKLTVTGRPESIDSKATLELEIEVHTGRLITLSPEARCCACLSFANTNDPQLWQLDPISVETQTPSYRNVFQASLSRNSAPHQGRKCLIEAGCAILLVKERSRHGGPRTSVDCSVS